MDLNITEAANSLRNDAGKKVKLLTYLTIAYLMMGLLWWSMLLYTKNQDAFQAKAEVIRMGLQVEGRYIDEASFLAHPQYIQLQKKYRRQEWMILGEAGLLIFSMSIGIWLMNRGYTKEIEVAQQKRNFLLSITHELKSPLAAIRLVFDTFKRRSLSEEQFHMLSENGIKDTERLKTLVDNLLLAARMEDNYQVGKEPWKIKEIVRPILNEITAHHSHAEIQVSMPEDLMVEVEKQGIQILLSNLLENAIKYSGEDPEIQLHITNQDKSFTITVADQGIGIAPEEREKVFQKFYRIGSEETRTTKGTGLGLYIVKGIVEGHKGQIQVESNFPKGTKIIITLPKK
jgi:two-component system phosphate regulon sensor histidine kinase PhoR